MSAAAFHGKGARATARAPLFVCPIVVAAALAGCVGGGDGGGGTGAQATAPSAAAQTSPDSPGPGDTGDSGESARVRSLPPLVADAQWVSREGERALRVSPTDYLRNHPSRDVADEAWRRVVVAIPAADTPGMQDQFVCHAQFASVKEAWYLEPRRPAVGYRRTVLAGCNPGDVTDVG